MDSAINFSDHSPVMPNVESVPAVGAIVYSHKVCDREKPVKSHYFYRWDRAGLQRFYHSTAYLLQTIKPPTHLIADKFKDVNCPHS